MFAGSWLFSVLVLAVFYAAGKLGGSLVEAMLPVTIIALVATVVESLPVPDFDNLTVPLAAVALGLLFF
jgi:dolichol kinase